jgi:hypothetical protein
VSGDAQSIFEALLVERGGRDCFNVTSLAVANKLAALLAGDTDGTASQIAQLCELLPPKPSDTEPPWDLSKLTDRELDQLDKLSRKAIGLEPPTPQPTNADRNGYAFIKALAALELRGVNREVVDRVKPTVEELQEVADLLFTLLYDAGIVSSDLGIVREREHGCQARLAWIEPCDVVIPASERKHFALPAMLPASLRFLPDAGDGIQRAGATEGW